MLVDTSCWSVLLYSHLTSVAQAISVLVDNIDKGNERELDPHVFLPACSYSYACFVLRGLALLSLSGCNKNVHCEKTMRVRIKCSSLGTRTQALEVAYQPRVDTH